MNKILKWLVCIPIINIDKWGYRYFITLSEKDQEYVQSLLDKGETVFIYPNGTYWHCFIMDLIPSPGFSGATLTLNNG